MGLKHEVIKWITIGTVALLVNIIDGLWETKFLEIMIYITLLSFVWDNTNKD